MTVPNTFANATTAIPLVQLDQNFNTGVTLGNTTVFLGNTTTSLGNVTLTGANVTATTLSSSGAFTEAKRAAVYVYTAWDPSDVLGSQTVPPGTAAATVTAANYITQSNSLGTLTNTAVIAGLFRFTITGTNEFNNAITQLNLNATLGGTGTILLGTPTTAKVFSYVTGTLQPAMGSITFYATMTAGQTVTILPYVYVTGSGTAANFTQQCMVAAEYCGAT
jgi:hypothetical protein